MITRPEPNSSEEGLLSLLLEDYDALLQAADEDTSDEAEETLIAKRADLVAEYAKKLIEMVVLSHEVRKLAQDDDEADVAESGGKCKCNGDCVPLTQLDDMLRKQGYVKAGETKGDEYVWGFEDGHAATIADIREDRGGCSAYDDGYAEGYGAATDDHKKRQFDLVTSVLAGVAMGPIIEQAVNAFSPSISGVLGGVMNLLHPKPGQPSIADYVRLWQESQAAQTVAAAGAEAVTDACKADAATAPTAAPSTTCCKGN